VCCLGVVLSSVVWCCALLCGVVCSVLECVVMSGVVCGVLCCVVSNRP
jgi:hypothetical protein